MDFFFMVGEALGADDERQVAAYVAGVGVTPTPPLRFVRSWAELSSLIRRPGWDARFAAAEEEERKRLRAKAAAEIGDTPLLERLSAVMDAASIGVHGAAAVAAARGGCSEPGLIAAAAGAAAESVYLAELAEVAGAGAAHPFALKRAVFAGGHWPLGVVDGGFYVF